MTSNGFVLKIGSYNGHWGGSSSAFPTLFSAIKSLISGKTIFGAPDPEFYDGVQTLLNTHDVLCLQEFPLSFDEKTGIWQPDIPESIRALGYKWHCVPQMNPTRNRIPNVPKRLLDVDQFYGNAIAVNPKLEVTPLADIKISELGGDFTPQRKYPVVRIYDPDSKNSCIVVCVQTKAPHIGRDLSGVSNPLRQLFQILMGPINTQRDFHETLMKVVKASKDSVKYGWADKKWRSHLRITDDSIAMPVIIAGDFNCFRRYLNNFVRKAYGVKEADSVEMANVGKTWPIVRSNGKRAEHRILRTIPGVQLDQIVGFNGIEIYDARRVDDIPSKSDHAPLSAECKVPDAPVRHLAIVS